MSPNSGITHRGRAVAEEEDLTPTLENLIVLLWLRKLHPNLPNIVKQKYGADLCLQSLASLKPEISLALDSLMDEAKAGDSMRVNRMLHDVSDMNTAIKCEIHQRYPKRGVHQSD